MAPSVLSELSSPPQTALRRDRAHPRMPRELVVRRAALAALTALTMLLLIGADNRIVLTVLPSVAAIAGLTVDEYNLHRGRRGRAPLSHGWCAAILGTAVLACALILFSAT